jgi:isoleucyl-tRNA synthetase
VDVALDNYNPTDAGRKIETFVDGLSNWYVRRSRRRFWKSESDADKMSAYNTLYECLVTMAKLMAPLAPFVSEAIYRNLVTTVYQDAPESVHLADFPTADRNKIDAQLSEDIRLAMRISSLGRAARSKAGIKVRQPLAEVIVSVSGGREERGLDRVKTQVMEELNVKDLRVEAADILAGRNCQGYVVGGLEEDAATGGYLVAVPAKDTISEELQAEGMARELVHRLQTMRRSADFDIADYIITYYQGDEYITRVMSDWGDYIRQETLSRKLVDKIPPEGVYTESIKISGRQVTMGVVRETKK